MITIKTIFTSFSIGINTFYSIGILYCKKQYKCKDYNKTQVTSLEPFISRYCNYSNDIAEKALNYDFFVLISYVKKSELKDFENDVQIPHQTLYQLTTVFSELFLTRQEKINEELLK